VAAAKTPVRLTVFKKRNKQVRKRISVTGLNAKAKKDPKVAGLIATLPMVMVDIKSAHKAIEKRNLTVDQHHQRVKTNHKKMRINNGLKKLK